MKLHAFLVASLSACGGGPAATSGPAPARPAADCTAAHTLAVPGKRDNAPAYRAGIVCEDECAVTVTHDGITRSFPIEAAHDDSTIGVRVTDVDGDGRDEAVVLTTLIDAYGPEGQMEIIERSLLVLDAATLDLRWSAAAWSSDPPEVQSTACTSTASLQDTDCDGRRETLTHVRTCDAPMCAGVRAGKPSDNDFIRDECAASSPRTETLTFRAATAGAAFTAAAAAD